MGQDDKNKNQQRFNEARMEHTMASKPPSYQTATIISESKSFQSNNNIMNIERTSQTSASNFNSSSTTLLPKNVSHHEQQQGGQNACDIFTPHPHDVLCGRGGLTNNHKGNAWYRRLVSCNRPLYRSSPKHTKLLVSKAIVEAVSSQSPPGRFLERHKKTGLWSRVPYKRAVDKTSQALREKDRVEVEFHVGPHVSSSNNASAGEFFGIGNQQCMQGQSDVKMSLQELALAAVERAGGMPDQMQTPAPLSPSKPCPPIPTPATQLVEQTQNLPSKIPSTFTSLSPKGAPVIVPAYSETLARQHQQHNQHSPPTSKRSTTQSLPLLQQPQSQLQQGQQNQIGQPPFQSYLNGQSAQYIQQEQQQPNVDITTTSTNRATAVLPPTRAVPSKKHKDNTYPSSPNVEKKPRLLWDHHHSPPTQTQQEQHQAYPSHSEAAQQAGVAVAPSPPTPLATAASSMYGPLPPVLESLQTRASSLFRFLRETNINAGSTANDVAEVTSADKSDVKTSLPLAALQQQQNDNMITDSVSPCTGKPVHSCENNVRSTSRGHQANGSVGASSSIGGINDVPILTEPLQTRASSMIRFLKDSNICSTRMANDAAEVTTADKNDGKTSLPPSVPQQQQSQQNHMIMDSGSASPGIPVHSNGIDVKVKSHRASGSIGTSSSTSSGCSDAPLLTQLVNVATSEYYLREKDRKKESPQHKYYRKQSSSSHNKSDDTTSDYDPTQDMPALRSIASAPFRQVSSWGMPSVRGDSMSISSASSVSSSKSPSPVTAAPSTFKKSVPGHTHQEGQKQILAGVNGEKKVVGMTQKAGSCENGTSNNSGEKKPSLLEDYDESSMEARLRSICPE